MNTTDSFTRGYMECALWASNNDNGENNPPPLDETHGVEDFAPETIETVRADCERFQRENTADIEAALPSYEAIANGIDPREHAGHDFWLTRNGHGAGFWDGDLPDALGDRLTQAAHGFGECSLYIGDDNKIYCG